MNNLYIGYIRNWVRMRHLRKYKMKKEDLGADLEDSHRDGMTAY